MSIKDFIATLKQRLSGQRERELEEEIDRVYDQMDALIERFKDTRQNERMRIVKWLRECTWPTISALEASKYIEKGEHWK